MVIKMTNTIGATSVLERPPARDYWPTVDWKTSSPEAQGLSTAVLDGIITGFAADTLPALSGVVVVRHGYLVYEQYFNGFHKKSLHSLYSVSKSFMSALVGVALKQGLLSSVDQRLMDFFPELDGLDVDPRVRTITLHHLLSMTSGWDKKTELPIEIRCKVQSEPGFVEASLLRPMVNEPGAVFAYDSQAMHLLSTVIGKVAGMKSSAFAAESLMKPLGIWQEPSPKFQWRTNEQGPHHWFYQPLFDEESGRPWMVDANGDALGWTGLHLTLRDMAKFGYLYLNGGMWNGTELIPADYVSASATPHSTGGPGPEPTVTPYGYLWWVPKSDTGMFHGWGAGRQFIYVIPGLDMVVAVTARHVRNDSGRVIDRFILPAVNS